MSSFSRQTTVHFLANYNYIGYFQNFRNCKLHSLSPKNHNLHSISNRYFASNKRQQSTNNESSTSTPLPHHYTTLNIDSNTSIDDIKKSYNNLMKQWHPDLYMNRAPTQQQEAQKKFLSIREAYEIIINHKSGHKDPTKDKMDIHAAHGQKHRTGFTAGRRTPNVSYSYYSWGRKVYEAQQNAEKQETTKETEEEEEETEEVKYSEQYKQNKTWIGRAMEELYDWMVFLYQRNPSWMQFFLITAACAGLVQAIWHFMYPNINDSDPDRIWNVFNRNKKHKGSGYQPSMSAAMQSTPNLVALQPHFKGHTLYDTTVKRENVNKFERENDEDFSDFKEHSTLTMFAKINMNSTVNRDSDEIKKKKKKKKKKKRVKRDDIEVTVIDDTGKKSKKIINKNELGTKRMIDDIKKHGENVDNTQENNMEGKDENEKVISSKKVELRRPVLEYNEIPLELRSTPMGILLASYAADTGELPTMQENGQYDWSPVIERYRKLNEQNEKELQSQ